MRTTNTIRTRTIAITHAAKNVALFLLAPFIGLIYAVLLPFVGIAMLLWTAAKALAASGALGRTTHFLKALAVLLAAPFIGLVYVLSFPFVGIAMLLWSAVDALAAKLAGAEVWNALTVGPRYQAA